MAENVAPTVGQPRPPRGSTAGINLLASAGPAVPGPATSGCADTACTDGCCGSTRPVRDQAWLRASRIVWALSWFSLAWMTAEGALGLLAGVSAGSISLVGWALGSVIEGLASVIVVWRFTGRRTLSDSAEQRAQKGVAVSFFLLAPYLAVRAGHDLWSGHVSTFSTLGVVVTASSVVLMPILGRAKKRLGRQLHSTATAGEGAQNLMCAAQAAAVLIGLGIVSLFGWTFIDPVVGLALAGWAIFEGRRAWRGEQCC
jgi:divalent metal cation (Fe/Co/Zn/Cd) transporter